MHPLVEHLLQIDPPVRMTGHDNSQPDTEIGLVTSIMKLANLELVDIISWAKVIPGEYRFRCSFIRIDILQAIRVKIITCL